MTQNIRYVRKKRKKKILEGEIPTQFRAKAEQSFTNLPTPPWKTENKEQSSQLSLFLVFLLPSPQRMSPARLANAKTNFSFFCCFHARKTEETNKYLREKRTCKTAFASSVFTPSTSIRFRIAATDFASLNSKSPDWSFLTSAAFVVA